MRYRNCHHNIISQTDLFFLSFLQQIFMRNNQVIYHLSVHFFSLFFEKITAKFSFYFFFFPSLIYYSISIIFNILHEILHNAILEKKTLQTLEMYYFLDEKKCRNKFVKIFSVINHIGKKFLHGHLC